MKNKDASNLETGIYLNRFEKSAEKILAAFNAEKKPLAPLPPKPLSTKPVSARVYLFDAILAEATIQWEPQIQKTVGSLYHNNKIGIIGMEKDDIAQVLHLGLRKAVKTFDASKGWLFHTYLTKILNTTSVTVG